MHKTRFSLNLNKIIIYTYFFMQKSLTKFALLSLTFHFSDTFFLYFLENLRENFFSPCLVVAVQLCME